MVKFIPRIKKSVTTTATGRLPTRAKASIIDQYGNTKELLLNLIKGYAKGYKQKYHSMSQDEAINNGYDMIENAYNLLKIKK